MFASFVKSSLALAFFLLFSPAVVAEPFSDCDRLEVMAWGGFTIEATAFREATEDQPAHCMVKGTIDAEIRFELLLPLKEAWNGRFVMGGGGGYVGNVQNQALDFSPSLLADGFVTVGTDTGHRGPGTHASWALNRLDREINFGHRAIHLTAQTAKTIIRLYYDRDIAYSYFLGCSRGGGQAMMESQRYPDDFDGIVSGAPAFSWAAFGAQFVQISRAMYPDPHNMTAPVVRPASRRLLEDAILAKCDTLDGLEDGIMNDPRECSFKPDELPRCENDKPGEGCITNQELHAIKTVYGGPTSDGKKIHAGFPFGGEAHPAAWSSWIAGSENAFGPGHPSLHFAFGTEMFKYIVFDDSTWDYSTYDFSTWREDTRRTSSILDATDPDMTHFNVSGGKIIYWTGWSDAALTALGIINYYEQVQKKHKDVSDFARLFLMPGVAHCGGGPGPDRVDWLGAIQKWVEDGEAPERVVATKWKSKDEISMQRPLCAYPLEAKFNGTGDGSTLESFECVLPEKDL